MAKPRKPAPTKKWKAPPATPGDFEVDLAKVTASVETGVVLELTVRNRAAAPRTFCTFGTPFEGIIGDVIEITDEKGAPIAGYQGPMVDRPPPGPTDYQTLRAGESLGVRFDLSGSYTLVPGAYRMRTGDGLGTLPRPAPLALQITARGPKPAKAEERLEVTLTPAPGASSSGGVFVTVVVRNLGTKPQRFSRYHTPFEGMRNQFIELHPAGPLARAEVRSA